MTLYERFHGNPPANLKRVVVATPKEGEKLVAVGRIIEIVYEPFGSSKRKGIHFVHTMGDLGGGRFNREKPILAVSQDGKSFYIIKDRALTHFTERGIIS